MFDNILNFPVHQSLWKWYWLFILKFSRTFSCFLDTNATSMLIYSWDKLFMEYARICLLLCFRDYSPGIINGITPHTRQNILNWYLSSESSSCETQLAVCVLSRALRSFTTEKLEAKRLGHFSKAVTELSFPLEYFKSETAEFKPVRIQAVQAFTHTYKHGHTWREKCPPFCLYCIWWKSSTRKGWAIKYISLAKWSTIHLELAHLLTKQSWYSFIMPAGILNYVITFLATWCKELIHWKRPWCWERLRAGGEGDNRGWDGWVASLTRWTWV